MSVTKEDLGKNMYKLTIEVSAEDFTKAYNASYQKNKGRIALPGFRKGKAPLQLIEKAYGAGVFYEDAANDLIEAEYPKAAEESGLEIVSRPEIDVEQIEKGKSFIFTAKVAVKPEVELGKYKGVEVDKLEIEVTDEEVNAEIDKEREKNSRMVNVEDRPVANGDTVNLDYLGSVDGVPFDGGAAQGYDLVIGSGSFIPGFEDQLIGAAAGADVDVNVTFPEEYHAEELAGKPALFKCHINSIKTKELPEADDEFVKDVTDFETLDEYKADLKKKLTEDKEKQAKAAREDAAIEAVIADSKMEIPDAMVDTQKRQMAEDFAQRLKMQGLSIEQYFQFTGLTAEKLLEQMEPQALKRIQSRLVLEAVAKAENIEVSDEDIENEYKKMAEQYQMELDKVKELIGENEKKQIAMDLKVEKAVELIASSAVEK
ncbi:MAG: trigger factor [Lachnospiraceae bacterium]|nr:trigger factor [Lachnospiraceae bacterium]